ncbi:MAG: AmmeMemoRadiSam system protein B [candidate division Zixibacteria bacterium]|nr:AmmeMemoRadiSam system protein B [candidate division Zixibacteria bacterium]
MTMKEHFEIRRPMVAGSFYPSNPVELAKQMAEFFANAPKKTLVGQVKALVVPHAGYKYSGQIAANAYKQIEGEIYDVVVVIAPSHRFFRGVSVYSGGGYQTPLGVVEIDRKLSGEIAQKHPGVFSSNVGHSGSGGQGEHSLEVQLPFLQTVLGKFKLIAIMMGEQEESAIRATAEVVTAVLKDKNALIIASTDLSHFYPEKEANRLDKNFEKALTSFETNKIIDVVEQGKAEACGFGPVAAMVEAERRIGGKEVEIISYGTSGAITGDFSEVVGYLSAVVIGKMPVNKRSILMGRPAVKTQEGYTDEEKAYLRRVVIMAVEAGANNEKFNMPPIPTKRLKEKRGAFVTLNKQGMLRGCIGLVQAKKPLADAVANMAIAAAFEDPRFPEVTADELNDLDYEISVMSPLVLVTDINKIMVGRDGLMIRWEMHSGLLLPQVASEQKWNRITFLEQTCLKAGLPKNSYKDKQAKIYKFSVDKF